MAFSVTLLSGNQTYSFETGIGELLSVDKVYSRTTIDDDFDDNTVIVVLDRTISGVNKKHNLDFFGEEEIVSIEDLTVVTDRSTVIDEQNWEQVLLVTFAPNRILQSVRDKRVTDIAQVKKEDILDKVFRLKNLEKNYIRK